MIHQWKSSIAGMVPTWLLAVSLLATVFNAGCGPVEPDRDGGSSAAQSGAKVAKVAPGDLRCPVGEYMPALMGDRLEIAAPKKWDWERPGEKYLVGFIPKGSKLNSLPRILVSAEENSFPEFDSVTESNVREFAKRVAEQHAGEKLAEPVEPVILGENAFVCYATLGKRKNAVVTKFFLETIAEGQHYTIRLEVYEQQFAKFRDAAYAVACSMKFGSGAGSTDSDKTPPSDTQ